MGVGVDAEDREQHGAQPSLRRSPRDMARLEARLLSLLHEWPGLTRAEAALQLGIALAALDRPVTNLLHAGRIRREGHKSRTRYWPDLARSREPSPDDDATQCR